MVLGRPGRLSRDSAASVRGRRSSHMIWKLYYSHQSILSSETLNRKRKRILKSTLSFGNVQMHQNILSSSLKGKGLALGEKERNDPKIIVLGKGGSLYFKFEVCYLFFCVIIIQLMNGGN
jgi:hypothetical protein